MELEISPEPTPEQRAAIAAAIARLLGDDSAEPGPWWRAGIREGVAVDGEEPEEDV